MRDISTLVLAERRPHVKLQHYDTILTGSYFDFQLGVVHWRLPVTALLVQLARLTRSH